MRNNIMFADLDGTLIFSAKRRTDSDIIIERKSGEPISCITKRQAELFPGITGLIPVTTRSVEQYRRIDFESVGFRPGYALCANGGVLLANGIIDGEWREWSAEIYRSAQDELGRLEALLERDESRTFEIRRVDGLFLFTKSNDPQGTVSRLGQECELCEAFNTGEKVYALPKALNKGAAAKRLAQRLGISEHAAAGDSLMDLPLLNSARTALFTDSIPASLVTAPEKLQCPKDRFPEFVTEYCVCGEKRVESGELRVKSMQTPNILKKI